MPFKRRSIRKRKRLSSRLSKKKYKISKSRRKSVIRGGSNEISVSQTVHDNIQHIITVQQQILSMITNISRKLYDSDYLRPPETEGHYLLPSGDQNPPLYAEIDPDEKGINI